MKKIILLFSVLLLFTGCSRNNVASVKNEIHKKYDKSSGYLLKGELEINNNDDVYNYDVEVLHKKENNYKIELINKDNDFKQIILKNNDGVFLYTPSLNKSFKFQSNWPYNHSQIYLLSSLLNDIDKDKNLTFEMKDNKFIYMCAVDYPNNRSFSKQKIVFDSKYKLNKVVVYNDKDQICMEFNVTKLKYSPNINLDEFELEPIVDSNDDSSIQNEDTKETSVLEDVIYPLFVPNGTKLVDEEKVVKESGERVIMTYDGEKSFLLVEETKDVFDEFTLIPTSGEPYQLMDTIGVINDNSLSWTSGNKDYYLVSDVMSQQELIEIAESIVGIPSMK